MIDRNFPYKMNFRGGGRTTRLMIEANDLARDPQTIVYLFPRESMAQFGIDWMAGVLHQLADHTFNVGRLSSGRKCIYLENGSVIHVIPWSMQPGQFVAEAARLSILFDHTCSSADDFWAFNGPMMSQDRHYQVLWEQACQVTVAVAEAAKSNRPQLFRYLL